MIQEAKELEQEKQEVTAEELVQALDGDGNIIRENFDEDTVYTIPGKASYREVELFGERLRNAGYKVTTVDKSSEQDNYQIIVEDMNQDY